ncbi:MAG: hypothetical protein WD045_03725 [Pirellulaceae bacterium]
MTIPTPRLPVVEVLDDDMAEILRQKTPQQRLHIAFGMWESARAMIRGTLRAEHPDWTEKQIAQETAHRLSHGATRHVPGRT